MSIYQQDYTGQYVYGRDYNGFVYIWTDHKKKMFYIGSHMGSLDDGYTGSNKRFKKAYKKRPQTMSRVIIQYHDNDNRKVLYEKEQYWLDCIKDDELGVRFYNIKKAARGYDSKTSLAIHERRIADGTHHFLGPETNNRRIENGTHPFVGPELQRKRIADGTHHFLGGEIQRKRIADGTHPFVDPEFQRLQAEAVRQRVADGTHHFLGGEIQRKRVEDGTHPFTDPKFQQLIHDKVNQKFKDGTHKSLSGKITAENVPTIRNDPRPQQAIANEYGVSRALIGLIKQRKLWKHIP